MELSTWSIMYSALLKDFDLTKNWKITSTHPFHSFQHPNTKYLSTYHAKTGSKGIRGPRKARNGLHLVVL